MGRGKKTGPEENRGPWTLEHLIGEIVDISQTASTNGARRSLSTARRSRAMRVAGLSMSKLQKVWSAICAFILQQLESKRGVNIPRFARFAHNKSTGKPVFILNDGWARSYSVRLTDKTVPPSLGVAVELNYSMLAHTTQINKDDIKAALTEMLTRLGEVAAKGKRPVILNFCELGALYCDHHRLQFSFGGRDGHGRDGSSNPAFFKHTLESAKGLTLAGGAAGPAATNKQAMPADNVPPLSLSAAAPAAGERLPTPIRAALEEMEEMSPGGSYNSGRAYSPAYSPASPEVEEIAAPPSPMAPPPWIRGRLSCPI